MKWKKIGERTSCWIGGAAVAVAFAAGVLTESELLMAGGVLAFVALWLLTLESF